MHRSRRCWERFSIYLKLPILSLVTLLLATAYFSWYGYRTSVDLMTRAIDERLLVVTSAAELFLPPGYLDRAADLDVIGDDEYASVQAKFKYMADITNIEYLYVLAEFDGKIYSVASNREEFRAPYDDEWSTLDEVRKDGVTRYDIGVDSYGSSRSIIRRIQRPGDDRFYIGADISLKMLEDLRSSQLRHYFLTGIFSFFLVGAVSFWIVWMITTPLKKLSDFVENLGRSSFSASQRLDPRLLPVSSGTADEVRLLAKNFDAMQGELATYIERLALTAAARERAESEMRIAGEIQQALLSHIPLKSDRISVWGEMIPAREAAGDFYDCVSPDNRRLVFLIGDVSGKGVPAAMFMATCLTLFRAHIASFSPDQAPEDFLAQLISRVDRELSAHNDTMLFVTCQAGLLDTSTGEAVLMSAGHPPPARLMPDGKCFFPDIAPGFVLGMNSADPGAFIRFRMEPGEALLLYTDGLTEAFSPKDELFGDKRALAELERLAGMDAKGIVGGMFSAMRKFCDGREQSDDLALLLVQWKPGAI